MAEGVAYATESVLPDGRAAEDKPGMAAVNYLRHVKAKYHSLLDSAPMSRNGTGRFGTDNRVYKAISTSILDEIARLYPDLSDAVERQNWGLFGPTSKPNGHQIDPVNSVDCPMEFISDVKPGRLHNHWSYCSVRWSLQS